jgi:adenine deaminase
MGGNTYSISGNIVDVVKRKIIQGTILVENGKIISIKEGKNKSKQYILPGFIDSHIHIESSMLIPSEFARLAMMHGTVATVSDPHEIANVLGIEGVDFMIKDGERVPLKFYFGAPSCVPATAFETSGATLGVVEIETLMARPEIKYLSEMMNFPGVLFENQEVMQKLAAAKKNGKPIDGHAPGVLGKDAEKYANAGISTDHECFTIEEAEDKIKAGMKVQIREGSAAKNYETLIPIIRQHPGEIMFCSDDKHPDDLAEGHINRLIKRSLAKGYDLFDVLRACTLIPRNHYDLEVGMLQEGEPADMVIVNNLEDFDVMSTYIDGLKVVENGVLLYEIESLRTELPNKFYASKLEISDIQVKAKPGAIRLINALDGQLVTPASEISPKVENGFVVSDTRQDVLKIVVYNRYSDAPPSIAFIHNFGFKNGAIASTVAHDSHNIIAVGATDEDIVQAINRIVDSKGGIALADRDTLLHLALPVAGLMSAENAYSVAEAYDTINKASKKLGSKLNAPFMTLSFMALLVIPELKLSDKGLFDGTKFAFTDLFVK